MSEHAPAAGTRGALHLFEGYGIELEYMIVRRDDLAVLPVADEVIKAVLGEYASDVEDGPIAWSNELVLHVLELKTNGPAPALAGLAELFQGQVARIDALLAPLGGRLMPTGMHPTMDPHAETRLWPHEHSPVYEAYHRIFDCRGHGWSNLQSMHVNLPFQGDAEFGDLHAAIRAVLPLLPGLAASTPLIDGRPSGLADTRLEVYRHNQRRVPSIAGSLVPEPVFTRADYQRVIYDRIFADIAPHDPECILREPFLNSRGAIARFDRDAIEIRLIDLQEHPAADLGVAWLVAETLRALIAGRWRPAAALRDLGTERLAALLLGAIRDGESAEVDDPELLGVLGAGAARCTVGEVWSHLAEAVLPVPAPALAAPRAALDVILSEGTLATRILRRLGAAPARGAIDALYRELCDCLAQARSLRAAP